MNGRGAGPRHRAVRHPVFARLYTRLSHFVDAKGGAGHRDALLAGLAGRVIEIGAGNGCNFAHYPGTVTEVLAVEPEPYFRARAQEAAAVAPVPVRVVGGVAERLPVPGASFDAAVASLVLCSVADPDAALAEVRRVLRPGGELRFWEHVRAPSPVLARMQQVADTVWPRLAGGCHTARDTVAAIERAGFEVRSLRAFRFMAGPTAPHVLGSALRA